MYLDFKKLKKYNPTCIGKLLMRVLRKFRKFAAVLALVAAFGSIGGAWMVAQSVAWMSMASQYVRQTNIIRGLAETFDGKHPCEMCHRISKHRTESSKSNNFKCPFQFETYSILVKNDFINSMTEGWRSADPAEKKPIYFDNKPSIPPPELFI